MNDTIKTFFEQHIMPVHEAIKKGNKGFLNTDFQSADESYFSKPQHPDYLYLSNIALNNESDLRDFLNKFWQNEPELLKLVPDLAALAFTLKEEHKEQSAELSPFVYAMF